MKNLPADEDQLLELLERWRTEADKAGYEVRPLFWYDWLASESNCRN